MKYLHRKYTSETEALQELVGTQEIKSERINKPFHHKDRVRVYPETGIAKKYRGCSPNAISKTYKEANAHCNLKKIEVNVPKVFGILHSHSECSLFLEYIDSVPLTSLLVSADPDLSKNLISTGKELGKMFEHNYLHGDLTSYHIFTNGQIYLFDLERTRKFSNYEFHVKLVKEWKGFIDSTQGRRWKIQFNKEQEEMVFEGVKKTLENKETKKILENIILNKI